MAQSTRVAGSLLVIAVAAASATAQPTPTAGSAVPAPVFADSQRAATLAQAFPEIDRLVTEFSARVPGVALGVIIDGELVHVTTRGVQDLGTKAPVTADTVFRIASMTKSVTAIAILQLRDAGKLSIEDPVAKYIPELAALPPATTDAPTLTIRHLLSHSEGLPEDNPWGDRQLARSDEWMAEAMKGGLPFSTVPGTAYEYSNYGFAILGRIVQVVSGERYDRYVTQHILGPLGMTSSSFDVAAVPLTVRAQGYRPTAREPGQYEAEVPLAHGAFGAMGGLWTSTRDLARYVAFHMSAWPARDGAEHPVLKRSSLREMQQVARHTPTSVTRQRFALDAPMWLLAGGYGYGLRINDHCDVGTFVGHGGGLPGYGSLMRWLPEHGVGLVAMGNVTYASWGQVFNEAMAALHATGALRPRVVQPSPRLVDMRDAVTRLVTGPWDDALAAGIAADNLWLDKSMDAYREQFARLGTQLGLCSDLSRFEVENALRGRWRVSCERGWLNIGITLAPTMPARVQALQVSFGTPPAARFQDAIQRVLPLIDAWNGEAARRLFAPDVDLARIEQQLQLTRLMAGGACTAGDTRMADGARAHYELHCARTDVLAEILVDATSGRVTALNVMPDGQRACVP